MRSRYDHLSLCLSVCLSDTPHTQRELDLPASQVLGLFNRAIRKFVQVFNSVSETAVEETLPAPASRDMEPVAVGLSQELVRTYIAGGLISLCVWQTEGAEEFEQQQRQKRAQLEQMDLSCYAVGGAEEEWAESLVPGEPSIVSVK